MNYTLCILAILLVFSIHAQESYAGLTEKATELMYASEDTVGYETALNLFEEAFEQFPDSINGTAWYFASILAADLKYYEKAFKYLTPLAQLETDEDGFPGWSFVLDEYAEEDYGNLMHDERWASLRQNALIDKRKYFEKLRAVENEFFTTSKNTLNKTVDTKELYQAIKTYNPYLYKQQQNYSISFEINDSITSSYLVHLPSNYNPRTSYPVLMFLHGAVRFSTFSDYQIVAQILGGWNRFYTKYADLHNVVLVFPNANKKYNWMTSDDGFFMVPEIVKQLKTAINVDDDKVFISGHSNGATGSFSYAMKQPGQFAGFYGFNTQPKVYTGGTFIENILNRSFVSFSTDQDYYYPPNANDSLSNLMDSINADYKDYRYSGFPHWFPEFDESEPAYKILFADLLERQRDPFSKNINWEFDDDNYGDIDWLSDIKLDTLIGKEEGFNVLNFKINEWLEYDDNDSLVIKKITKDAFDFPRKSGKIVAEYQDNIFRINTSRIQSLQVNISPEMVDLEKDIIVYINGKQYFKGEMNYDRAFMIQSFEENKDRKQVWVNRIELKV